VLQRIVVPLDGSEFAERALGVARALAERTGADLVLMSAAAGGPDDPRRYLDDAARDAGVDGAERLVVTDLPAAEAILSVAGGMDDRVVCMTSHGRGGLRWAVLGSVAEDVVASSPRTVVLVGPHCRDDWDAPATDVLVAVDGSERSELVALEARDWAHALGGGLCAAIVIHPLDVPDAEHPETLAGPIEERLRARGVDAHVAVLRGSLPAGALADYANDVEASMIAMTAHARAGFARVALGSVTMGTVNLSRCPVLVAHEE
jgi:nucleotide-binding universal stress UspA family protein